MKKQSVVVIAVLIVGLAGIAYWRSGDREPARVGPPEQPGAAGQSGQSATTEQPGATAQPGHRDQSASSGDNLTTSPANTVSPANPQPPKGFCERDFSDAAARRADASDLQQAGGLVYIFEREARLKNPYRCADYYLAHGLNIDAVDPREDRKPITGIFFAIQRNDPKMLHFMIDHGADLKKRAGKNDVKPLGYAYFLALSDTRINRNEVIGILDDALTEQAKAGKN